MNAFRLYNGQLYVFSHFAFGSFLVAVYFDFKIFKTSNPARVFKKTFDIFLVPPVIATVPLFFHNCSEPTLSRVRRVEGPAFYTYILWWNIT